MIKISKKLVHILFCLSFLLALTGAQPARAAGITVNSNADTVANDGVCTLREAITSANTDTASGAALGECSAGSSADTISFDANYTITLAGTQLPVVTTQITINGNGSTNTDIRANADPNVATSRVFEVSASGNLTLSALTVQNGHCAAMCATFPNDGGGIANSGTLTVNFSVLESNSTTQNGGGIYNTGTLIINNSTLSSNAVSDAGGGIYNSGTLSIINSTFSQNTAGDGGGGFYSNSGSATISHSSFTNNSSYNGGGAFSNESSSTTTITNSTIANNTSTGNTGGGIRNAGTMNIYNSTISGNSSSGGVYDGANIMQGDIGTPELNLYNTIVANSGGSDGDCTFYAGTVNATNTFIESTGSLACGLTNGVNGNIIGSDPALGSLTGSPAHFPLISGSLAINAGSNAICDAAPVNNESQNGLTRPQGGTCDIGSYEAPVSLTVKSNSTNDGWILESSETSNTGISLNSSATNLILGDDAANRQYRAILHFDTSSLPDNAVVTTMTLKIKQQGAVTGISPFTFASLYVDMRNPAFGNSILELVDFNFAAKKVKSAVFNPNSVSGWFSASFNNGGKLYINRTGTSQLRLYFSVDDNNNNIADFIRFYSGNAAAGDRPKLLITYYVP